MEDIKDLTTWGSNWMKLSSWNLEVAVVDVAAVGCDTLEDEGGIGRGLDGVGYLVER